MKTTIRYEGEIIGKDGLEGGNYEIYRGQHNMIAIKGPNFGENGIIFGVKDKSVSRKHLTVSVADDSVVLIDRGSQNGSYVDGQKFDRKEVSDLGEHELRLGCFSLELVLSE